MICPYCAHEETRVIDSRENDSMPVTRRRRECEKCGKRFTTYERPEIEMIVIKKDGRREAFDRSKLISGISKACQKRPVGKEQIEAVVEEIEKDLLKQESTEIPSPVIGELVMQKLKKLDKVAYVRFASVYREFTDLKSFEKELQILKKV